MTVLFTIGLILGTLGLLGLVIGGVYFKKHPLFQTISIFGSIAFCIGISITALSHHGWKGELYKDEVVACINAECQDFIDNYDYSYKKEYDIEKIDCEITQMKIDAGSDNAFSVHLHMNWSFQLNDTVYHNMYLVDNLLKIVEDVCDMKTYLIDGKPFFIYNKDYWSGEWYETKIISHVSVTINGVGPLYASESDPELGITEQIYDEDFARDFAERKLWSMTGKGERHDHYSERITSFTGEGNPNIWHVSGKLGCTKEGYAHSDKTYNFSYTIEFTSKYTYKITGVSVKCPTW